MQYRNLLIKYQLQNNQKYIVVSQLMVCKTLKSNKTRMTLKQKQKRTDQLVSDFKIDQPKSNSER